MTGCGCGTNGGTAAGACNCNTCCTGVRPSTPLESFNRPGLTQLAYRAGTYSTFLASMQARLAHQRALDGLTTRSLDDPANALLDCWAIVGEIITFHCERFANEGFLDTASDAISLGLLGRLVDFRPRPALGASGALAFTMAPGSVGVIPAGTQAMSVAGPSELPQPFETSETIDARADWNLLGVRTTRPSSITKDNVEIVTQVVFVGTSLGLRAGDRLVFQFRDRSHPQARTVAATEADFTRGVTTVTLVPTLTSLGRVAALMKDVRDRATKALEKLDPAADTTLEEILRSAPPVDLDNPVSALYAFVRSLEEWLALNASRVPSAVTTLIDAYVTPALRSARAALTASAIEHGLLDPQVDFLRDLARGMVYPRHGGSAASTSSEWDRAAPLVDAAAMVAALQRPPTNMTSATTFSAGAATGALDVQSGAVLRLLAGANPQLASTLAGALARQVVTAPPPVARVIALRNSAIPIVGTPPNPDGPWPQVTVPTEVDAVLDGTPDGVVTGAWFLVDDATRPTIRKISGVEHFRRTVEMARGAPVVEIPSTGVRVEDSRKVGSDRSVFWGGDELTLADEAITDDIGGDRIELDRLYAELQPGRAIAVSGSRTDIPGASGVRGTEIVMLADVEQTVDPSQAGDRTRSTLVLAVPLSYTYERDTVAIYGNVVAATQGATKAEVLGSGAAGVADQQFALKQVSATNPLTWLPDDTATGASDALVVRVDTVQWHEAPQLVHVGRNARKFVRTDGADGSTAVRFGNGGDHGARLPTGIENVTATYRVGAGPGGNLGADRITQLASRPLSVTAVTNPMATTGGARADTAADTHAGIPRRTLALDRLVSTTDYAAFAAARVGIGQASSALLFDGRREVVHVTIAGVDDAPIDDSDLLVQSLRRSLADLGDPDLPVRVAVREVVLLVLAAGIKVAMDYTFDAVEAQVRAALLDAFGFAHRRLGQSTYLSEVVQVIQSVAGVDYVDVDLFAAVHGDGDPIALTDALTNLSGVAQLVTAEDARFDEQTDKAFVNAADCLCTLTSIAYEHGTTLAALAELNPALRDPNSLEGKTVVVFRGIRPAQLALLSPDVPQTLRLRNIP